MMDKCEHKCEFNRDGLCIKNVEDDCPRAVLEEEAELKDYERKVAELRDLKDKCKARSDGIRARIKNVENLLQRRLKPYFALISKVIDTECSVTLVDTYACSRYTDYVQAIIYPQASGKGAEIRFMKDDVPTDSLDWLDFANLKVDEIISAGKINLKRELDGIIERGKDNINRSNRRAEHMEALFTDIKEEEYDERQ